MIDYILDNMIVNKREHKHVRLLRADGMLEYTICEEIAHEQRLAPEDERDLIKRESKTLSEVTDFKLLTSITNEMIDYGVLDLDEGGGDVMVVYEASSNISSLFASERIVVSNDKGVQGFCERHDLKILNADEYSAVIQSL